MADKTMEEMLDEEYEQWSPEKGDKLIGTFVGKREGQGKFKSSVYLLKTDRGLVGVWGCKIIDEKLTGITIGSEVGIKFLGVEKGEMGEYNNFKVLIGQSQETVQITKQSSLK